MANPMIHVAVGMACGAVLGAGPILRTWRQPGPVWPAVARWLFWSYALAGWAAVPGVLTRIGVPESVAHGAWANLFAGFPLIRQHVHGHGVFGFCLLAALILIQYGVVLAALRRVGNT